MRYPDGDVQENDLGAKKKGHDRDREMGVGNCKVEAEGAIGRDV